MRFLLALTTCAALAGPAIAQTPPPQPQLPQPGSQSIMLTLTPIPPPGASATSSHLSNREKAFGECGALFLPKIIEGEPPRYNRKVTARDQSAVRMCMSERGFDMVFSGAYCDEPISMPYCYETADLPTPPPWRRATITPLHR